MANVSLFCAQYSPKSAVFIMHSLLFFCIFRVFDVFSPKLRNTVSGAFEVFCFIYSKFFRFDTRGDRYENFLYTGLLHRQ